MNENIVGSECSLKDSSPGIKASSGSEGSSGSSGSTGSFAAALPAEGVKRASKEDKDGSLALGSAGA